MRLERDPSPKETSSEWSLAGTMVVIGMTTILPRPREICHHGAGEHCMRFRGFALIGLSLAMLVSCAPKKETGRTATMKKQSFGKTAAGVDVDLYTLANGNGVEAAITNYGGIVVSLKTPDRDGQQLRRRAGLRHPRRLPQGPSLLRRAHRPLRQPHRQGPLHAGRQRVQARRQQRREPSARRHEGLRQGRLEGSGRLHAGRPPASN